MTDTDISPEAVERLACILEGRGGFVKDSTITATLRALSAALTQSRAETAAAVLQIPSFPDHMSKVMLAKTADLPSRIVDLVEAIKSIPDDMSQYQWQADPKQSFGSKWVRCVADYIAAANPDTVSMLIAENADLQAKLADTIRALATADQSSALAASIAAAEARGMRRAAEIAERMEEALRQGYSITSANEVGKVYCSILAAIPQGDTTND